MGSESGVTGSSWGSSSYSETACGWWELPSLPDVNVVAPTAQAALEVVNLVYPDVENEISCWWEEIEGARHSSLWGMRNVPEVSSFNVSSKTIKVRRALCLACSEIHQVLPLNPSLSVTAWGCASGRISHKEF